MNAFLVISTSDQWDELRQNARDSGSTNWSIVKKARPGNLALFYFGVPYQAVKAAGIVASEPASGDDPASRRSYCNFDHLQPFGRELKLTGCSDAIAYTRWMNGHPYQNTRQIPSAIASILFTEIVRRNPGLKSFFKGLGITSDTPAGRLAATKTGNDVGVLEGAITEILIELRFRDPGLKAQLIADRGVKCEICGFDFGCVYGDYGSGYIEIHHFDPLSRRKTARRTTPDEVGLVCANCHRMLHRNGAKPISMDELRELILENDKEPHTRSTRSGRSAG